VTKPTGKPVGRPEFVLTDQHLKEIEMLAALATVTEGEMAHFIGCSPKTFTKLKQNDDGRILTAIEEGKLNAKIGVSGRLLKSARNGNVSAGIWWEKTRMGMSERHEVAVPDLPAIHITVEK